MLKKQDLKEVEELSNSSNIIGKGTTLEGNIETFGNIRVDIHEFGLASWRSCARAFRDGISFEAQ